MKELILTSLFIGNLTVTAYRSVKSQTDASPWRTSINERVNNHGVAVSQDLLVINGGTLNYGDQLYIEGIGFRVVNDCMNARMKKHLDIWAETKEDEHKFFKRWKNGKTQVWVIRRDQP